MDQTFSTDERSGFHRARLKGRSTGRKSPGMKRALFKVPLMRKRCDRDVYPIIPQYDDDEYTLPMSVHHDATILML
ncbi:hypothetical protein TNCV_4138161 [Trichonephila clavipes]|nr:hypothetical protein TNCV_4138161 [Trichonephila clavipes]